MVARWKYQNKGDIQTKHVSTIISFTMGVLLLCNKFPTEVGSSNGAKLVPFDTMVALIIYIEVPLLCQSTKLLK